MPAYIYGDSYGDVGNRALAYDAARDRRFSDSLAQLRANAALELQARDQSLRSSALQAQLAQQAQQDARRERDFLAAQSQDVRDFGYRSGQDDVRNRLSLLTLLSNNARHGYDEQTQRSDQDYKEALAALTSAQLPLGKVLEQFPNLTPTHKTRLNQYYGGLVGAEEERMAQLKQGKTELEAQIKSIMDQPVNLRNQIKSLNQQKADAAKQGDKVNAALIGEHLDEIAKLGKPQEYEKLALHRLNAIISDEHVSENYIVNPVTGAVKLKKQALLFPPVQFTPAEDVPGSAPMSASPPSAIRPTMSAIEKQILRVKAERAIRLGNRDPIAVGRIFMEQTGEPLF